MLVQVCDASGKPLNKGVRPLLDHAGRSSHVALLSVHRSGEAHLVIHAARGAVPETVTVSINVAGPAKTFRTTLNEPAPTALPYLMVKKVFGQHLCRSL